MWVTPYTDWVNNPHNPLPADFNRIEGNIAQLLADTVAGKALWAAALVFMGRVATSDMTYAQLDALTRAISDDANAIVSHVLAGETFYQGHVKKTGTMPNRAGFTAALAADAFSTVARIYLRPATGFYDGIDDACYFDDADFIAANFPSIYSFFGLQGSMPVRGSEEYAGWRRATVTGGVNSVDGRVHLAIPLGAYLTGRGEDGLLGVFADEADFIAANWPTTKTMFGLPGTMPVRSGNMLAPSIVGVATRIYMYTPQGWHNGTDSTVYYDDADFTAENIPYNKNFYGLQGTRYDVHPGDNIASYIWPGTGDSGYSPVGTTPSNYGTHHFTIQASGIYRVKFSIRGYYNGAEWIAYGQVYKNGAPYGTVRSANGTNWVAFAEDLFFSAGDVCTFYIWRNATGIGVQTKDFYLCTAEAPAFSM